MGYTTNDVYYQPETFGLQVVGEMEWSEPCYDFDMTVVWKDGDGVYYWASDAGCSCPSPFQNYTSISALESGTKYQAIKYIQTKLSEYGNEYSWHDITYAETQAAKLIEKVVTS